MEGFSGVPSVRRGLLKLSLALALVGGSSAPASAFAQEEAPEKTIEHDDQIWLAYMTQTRLSQSYSWWNDFHYVPNGFFLARTGLTYIFPQHLAVTGGYAFGLMPLGAAKSLERPEHRPWAQAVYTGPLGGRWSISERIRYDARLRQNVAAGELTDGFDFTSRLRFALNIRRNCPELRFLEEYVPYFTIGNEVLLQFGENVVYNTFDQHRLLAAVGVTRGGVSYQVGYMNRFVQLASGDQYVMNHTLLVWVFQTFDLRGD